MVWVSFFLNQSQPKQFLDWSLIFLAISANIAKKQKIQIGLISSASDRHWLDKYGIKYCEHISGDVSGKNGAQTKLKAILNYLPEDEPLCDMDIIWPINMPQIDKSKAWALNPEPILFYQDYSGQKKLIYNCLPTGKLTANAGFLFLPKKYFREYAKTAFGFSQTTNCIGHTFEQMFFVKFCQDIGIELKFIYPEIVKCYEGVERCYQSCGIRHPFSFKGSLQEVQRFITIGMELGDPDYISHFIKSNFPIFKSMLNNEVFKYTKFSV